MSEIDIEILWETEEDKKVEKLIYKAVKEALNEEKVKCPVSISVVITDNNNIHKINLEYRRVDAPTDVLSFPGYEKEEWNLIKNKSDIVCMGDIVISTEKVIDQAEEYGNTFEREFCYLIVHGMLHLMGYDHIKEDERKNMRATEEKVMERLNLKRD